MKLVDVKKLNPNIVFDIRYSTRNNFTGEVLYEDDSCYLLDEVAQKACKIQEELEEIHLKLVIKN